ncbi:hypothetical protein [Sphingomicrobium sediminis]|uniref:Uncharacterized protein n=1 Tax=Sphingomicrobium sediminis TaxID=2950949 RepID=A0A9X2EI99_9SPHN|nr:hypothetical protein [Sphingomicrobium sediminis]MCM8558006.1 hypothetical protein [Sphingomicrobium sediminis]
MAALPDAGWRFQESANGARLFYVSETNPASQVMILTCPIGVDRLIVRLPEVVPVGSEERLTIGHGNDLAVLMVDPMRDNGSVAGRGPIPDNLDTMLKQGIAAAYGSYSLGDLPAVPGETSARFISACS